MNLEVIIKNVDFDTYKNFDLSRRAIKNSNTSLGIDGNKKKIGLRI